METYTCTIVCFRFTDQSPLFMKAICFVLRNLWILVMDWKESFMNYVEPITRIPETAVTEEIYRVG